MKKLLLGTILLFSVMSCSKDSIEETNSSVVFTNENLKYKRLLKEVVEQKDPTKGDSIVYKYDKLKRLLSKVIYKTNTRPNNYGTEGNVQKYRYTYNDKNQIDSIYSSEYNIVNNIQINGFKEYGSKVKYNKIGIPLHLYNQDVYDEYGHYAPIGYIVKWDNNHNLTDEIFSSLTKKYTYDNKHNALNGIYDTSWVRAYSGGENNVLTYSADGVKKITYEYEYNSDLFPTKVTRTELDNIYNDRIRVVNYIYEK